MEMGLSDENELVEHTASILLVASVEASYTQAYIQSKLNEPVTMLLSSSMHEAYMALTRFSPGVDVLVMVEHNSLSDLKIKQIVHYLSWLVLGRKIHACNVLLNSRHNAEALIRAWDTSAQAMQLELKLSVGVIEPTGMVTEGIDRMIETIRQSLSVAPEGTKAKGLMQSMLKKTRKAVHQKTINSHLATVLKGLTHGACTVCLCTGAAGLGTSTIAAMMGYYAAGLGMDTVLMDLDSDGSDQRQLFSREKTESVLVPNLRLVSLNLSGKIETEDWTHQIAVQAQQCKLIILDVPASAIVRVPEITRMVRHSLLVGGNSSYALSRTAQCLEKLGKLPLFAQSASLFVNQYHPKHSLYNKPLEPEIVRSHIQLLLAQSMPNLALPIAGVLSQSAMLPNLIDHLKDGSLSSLTVETGQMYSLLYYIMQ
jgi:hypothetical protein